MRQLMQSGERHVSKEALLERVWGFESNAVENHVEVYVGVPQRRARSCRATRNPSSPGSITSRIMRS